VRRNSTCLATEHTRTTHTSTRPWRTRTRSCARAPKRKIPVAATGASLSPRPRFSSPVLACVLADAAPSQTRRRGRRWIRTTRRPLRSEIMGSLHAATVEVRFYAWIRPSGPAGLPAHADADGEAAEKGEDEKARASGMRDWEIPELVRGAPTWLEYGAMRKYCVARWGATCGVVGIVVVDELEKQGS
jgi:hypothetical protein